MVGKPKSISFEEKLEQLETLVVDMEKGELSLDDSLKAFEKGIGIARECQKALAEAEQKIEILSQSDEPT